MALKQFPATGIIAAYNKESTCNLSTEELTNMVQELDISLRIPYEMYYVGHPYQDIANTLKLPEVLVKHHILDARKELKLKIESRYIGVSASSFS